VARYKAEPYVIAADVYSLPPHTGRGGWTWYTGSASWMYQGMLESLLGLKLNVDKLTFSPCWPETWQTFQVHYRFRETVYHISVSRRDRAGVLVVVDGAEQGEPVLHLRDDRREHWVEFSCPPGTPPTVTATGSAAGTTTAVQVTAPPFFQDLDPDYLCSGLLPPTQSSVRIEILQNGIPYTVGVAAVDTSLNASPIAMGFVQEPVPTINLYQAYRKAGGQATGGYCALAGRGARLGTISFLAGAGLLGLVIFRRRRRARRVLSRGLPWLMVTLAAGSAQAQVAGHVQTEEASAAQRGDYRTPRQWAIELRFGPYAPDIDSEFLELGRIKLRFHGALQNLAQPLRLQFFDLFSVERFFSLVIPSRILQILLLTVLLCDIATVHYRFKDKYLGYYPLKGNTENCLTMRKKLAGLYRELGTIIPEKEQNRFVIINCPSEEIPHFMFYSNIKAAYYKINDQELGILKNRKDIRIGYFVFDDEHIPDNILKDNYILKLRFSKNIFVSELGKCD